MTSGTTVMFEKLKALALRFAKVPPEPHAPAGSPGSTRIFRAATNYWKYLLVTWSLRQAVGAFVIATFLSMTATWQAAAEPGIAVAGGIHALELLGLGFFLLQVPFSLATTRLNYEMRWYIVTDRSLRIREGILGVREMTLTFANVQNIAIRQGPLQRLLGIADVVVRTAGGGTGTEARGRESRGVGQTMHTGILRAVDNAEQVRNMILDRLRRVRDAGLGDPDDSHQNPVLEIASGRSVDVLRDAARELLEEARSLRAARGAGNSP
jgi:membrane protein YdbS with pleckstrin-like domain